MRKMLMWMALAAMLAGAADAKAKWSCWKHLDAGAFDAVRYDAATRTMALRFATGEIYEYYDVPRGVVRGLSSADDKPAYFARKIRKAYAYRRTEPVLGGLVPEE
jgi:hypothetical protein